MIDFDSDAKLNQIGARLTINNTEKSAQSEHLVRAMMFDRMRSQLAGLLTKDAVRITENIYSTDYEVRLYVLTSDQLEKYVQKRAERMGYGMPSVTEQKYEPSDQR